MQQSKEITHSKTMPNPLAVFPPIASEITPAYLSRLREERDKNADMPITKCFLAAAKGNGRPLQFLATFELNSQLRHGTYPIPRPWPLSDHAVLTAVINLLWKGLPVEGPTSTIVQPFFIHLLKTFTGIADIDSTNYLDHLQAYTESWKDILMVIDVQTTYMAEKYQWQLPPTAMISPEDPLLGPTSIEQLKAYQKLLPLSDASILKDVIARVEGRYNLFQEAYSILKSGPSCLPTEIYDQFSCPLITPYIPCFLTMDSSRSY